MITDTHTHLYSEAFADDRDAVITRALQLGVQRFFIPAIDSTYTQAMYDLEAAYPNNMFLMAGLHPTHVKENYEQELAHVAQQLTARKFYAVGEIGIDLYWDKTFLKQQQQAFKQQIAWAKEYHLPIVIHCRDAFDEVFEILEQAKSPELRGIFHCFTGTYEQALQAISCGMKLGIGGVVTFKNGQIDQFIHQIDPSHIVLETDAPYLAPNPYRGKRNESAYIVEVLRKLAELYQITPDELAQITTQNAREVFAI